MKFVQACAGDACFLGNFRHAHCLGRRVQGVNEIGFVAVIGDFLKEHADFFRGVQVFGDVERFCLQGHGLFLQFVKKPARCFDVFGLSGFVAANKQQNHGIMPHGVINPQAVLKKALPDWQKTGRAYFQIYFLDFFIYFFYLEIDGGYFLIVRDYEKIGKRDEQM